MLSPRFALAGPVLTIERSRTLTLVITVDVSSPGVESVGTLAVLVTVPAWVVLTTSLTVAETWPGVSVPMLQVTSVLLTSVVHWGLVALFPYTPLVRASVQVALG